MYISDSYAVITHNLNEFQNIFTFYVLTSLRDHKYKFSTKYIMNYFTLLSLCLDRMDCFKKEDFTDTINIMRQKKL